MTLGKSLLSGSVFPAITWENCPKESPGSIQLWFPMHGWEAWPLPPHTLRIRFDREKRDGHEKSRRSEGGQKGLSCHRGMAGEHLFHSETQTQTSSAGCYGQLSAAIHKSKHSLPTPPPCPSPSPAQRREQIKQTPRCCPAPSSGVKRSHL